MIITLCGSTRFKDEFKKVEQDLTLQGHIILTCGLFNHADDLNITTEQKIQLDNLHKEKINMSDAIYVINPGGYIGESTYSEIDWAYRMKKKVYYLVEPEQENRNEQNVEATDTGVSEDSN